MKNKTSLKLNFSLLLIFILLLSSCGSRKDIVYFQNVEMTGISKSINDYNLVYKPDDVLTIVVSSIDLDVVRPFNLTAVTYADRDGGLRPVQQNYLVDIDGNIEFPVLGKIKIAGLNRVQATNLIKKMLNDYVKDPIVNIRNVNFKVTVLGEVNRPGTFTITNERITILEALGLAGDMNIQGERNNVLVVREQKGKKVATEIDITSPEMFNSPVYYLTQNDVVYVKPNNSKVKSSKVGPSTSVTLSIIGTLITAAALVVSITK